MNDALAGLLVLLDLERIEQDIFRGQSRSAVIPRVFGGQVAAQALVAAGRTVPDDRHTHSLHAYFLRPGDPGAPIVYTVDRIRDGRSFTTRRVVAVQHGQPIFHLSASFQTWEEGLDHQEPMPPAPDPETLATGEEMVPRLRRRLHRRGRRRPPPGGPRRRRPALRPRAPVRHPGHPARTPLPGLVPHQRQARRRRPAHPRLPDHVRLGHDAARLGPARPRPGRLDHRRHHRRQPRPRHVVPPPAPRRRLAPLRPALPVGLRRPGPGPGPHLHAGRQARRHGDPGRRHARSRADPPASRQAPGQLSRARRTPSTPRRKVAETSSGSERHPAAIAPSRSMTKSCPASSAGSPATRASSSVTRSRNHWRCARTAWWTGWSGSGYSTAALQEGAAAETLAPDAPGDEPGHRPYRVGRRGPGLPYSGLHPRPHPLVDLAEAGEDQFLLAREVPVQRGPGDLGLRDDPVDADRVDALRVEDPRRRREQPRPRRRGARAGARTLAVPLALTHADRLTHP